MSNAVAPNWAADATIRASGLTVPVVAASLDINEAFKVGQSANDVGEPAAPLGRLAVEWYHCGKPLAPFGEIHDVTVLRRQPWIGNMGSDLVDWPLTYGFRHRPRIAGQPSEPRCETATPER